MLRPPMALAVLVALAACGGPSPSSDVQATAQAALAAAPRSCAASPHVTAGPAGAADWPVYHRAADRRGVDPAATTANHAAPLWGVRLDGSMFAQPLVYQGLLIEATMHDTVYALGAARGCVAWQTSLGTAPQAASLNLKCNNITPELGITPTPAIDPATGTVYAVAFVVPGRYEMDALDLATGAIRWRHGIDLPDSNVVAQLDRPALTLGSGRVYASFGGRAGDCDNYHGFVVGVNADGSGTQVTYQAAPAKGAVWAPGGPVVLPGGDLLVSTGNSDELHTYDGTNAVVRLAPDLTRKDLFAAPDWSHLNQIDFDLGSVGPTVLDGQQVFSVGKEGVGYLLDLDHLGGVGGQRFQAPLKGGCYATGTTAYQAPVIYVPCDHSVTAVRVSGDTFDVAWRGPNFRAGPPIVADGLVWSFDFEGGAVFGLDPQSGAARQKLSVGVGEHFVSPSSSAGRLFVPAQRNLFAFSVS